MFNIGVEVGQLLFVVTVLIIWQLTKKLIDTNTIPPWLIHTPAYGIGALASFWTFERVASFWL